MSLLVNLDLDFVQSKLLYLLLLRSGQFSFLPDLYDAIGEDNEMMINLLSLFAGQSFSFPTIDRLAQYARDVKIYYKLDGLKGNSLSSAVQGLMSEYRMASDEQVMRRYRIMRGIADEAGVSVSRRR